MVKLKLSYFPHIMQRPNSLAKALILEKVEGKDDNQKQGEWIQLKW